MKYIQMRSIDTKTRDGSDNAAIEAVSLDASYRVERLPSMGRYDLSIRNTTYDRDNGSFKCMLKEGGTGRTLYTKTVGLTVLLKPSAPRISPSSPIATEGRPTNLTCSSTGGSPPPQVLKDTLNKTTCRYRSCCKKIDTIQNCGI